MNSKGCAALELIITVSLIAGAILLILGYLPYKVFLVQSGSMEPSIMTGDVIVVKKSEKYNINQVVTFKDADERIVTHRIINQESPYAYITKGDANQANDNNKIEERQIIGSVVFVIPKVGYLIRFIKTLPGLIVFFLIPAALLIFMEVKNIGAELHKQV